MCGSNEVSCTRPAGRDHHRGSEAPAGRAGALRWPAAADWNPTAFNTVRTHMAVRRSSAEWMGTLKEGAGTMRLGSGAYEGPFTFASRFESGRGTNPEELIGAAHAGCFSMFLSALLF